MNDGSWVRNVGACADVPFQTYECCYHIMLPWLCKYPWEDDSMKEPMTVSIDKCLLPEILKLWEMGIKTIGCGSKYTENISEKCYGKGLLKDKTLL